MKRIPKILLVLICLHSASSAFAEEIVNVYSSRKEQLIKPLLDKFTTKTGIKVNLVTADDDGLLEKLKLEGKNSPADVLFTADAGRLYRAKSMGLLAPVKSKVLEAAIPAHMRDSGSEWFGLTYRARPIFYVEGKVKPEELSTYADLTNAKWKGRICIRSSNNIYNQSLIAAMISHEGEAKTLEWTKGLVANLGRPPEGGDRDQIKAAAAGQCDIAIANTYYYGQMLTSKDEQEKAAAEKLSIFWPNQKSNEYGTHVNVSGAGLTKAAQHKDNASTEHLMPP